ncbi:hypothetical protein ACCC98_29650 [Rhizobium pisi]|uniref:hypothetical protein n=1 Tax=Rhizobium pisi TaxID=574561 RepID=UPI0039AEFECB
MISRKELYDLVWAMKGVDAAARLGISDSYLGRVCGAMVVPRPPPGYWRKLEVGQVPPIPPLPEPAPGKPRAWKRKTPTEFARPPRERPKQGPPTAVQARDNKTLHPLVLAAAPRFRSARTGPDGQYLKPRDKLLVDIAASPDGLDKAMRFASALFYRLADAGHRVLIATGADIFIRIDIDRAGEERNRRDPMDSALPWAPLRPTVVYVRGVPLGLSVVEASETRNLYYVGGGRFIPAAEFREEDHVGHTWETRRRVPSGRLKLTAYSPFHGVPWQRRWIEGPKSPLGNRLDEIVDGLESGAADLAIMLEKAGRFFC